MNRPSRCCIFILIRRYTCLTSAIQDIHALHAEIGRTLGSDPDEEQVQAYLEGHDQRIFWSKIVGACAVNSMFEWYAQACVCYAYLHDVPDNEHPSGERSKFRSSKWFKRGWTLQELVAPLSVVFLSKNWTVLGTKHVHARVIEEITHISRAVLTHDESLDSVGVAERMYWASERQTTRIEDEAYSLLGIFGIHMPTIYGEGKQAFIRLQEEILRRIPDQSLFAWGNAVSLDSPSDHHRLLVSTVDTDTSGPLSRTAYLFALSTTDFCNPTSLSPLALQEFSQRLSVSDVRPPKYTTTSYGLLVRLPIMQLRIGEPGDEVGVVVAPLACQNPDGSIPALVLSSHHEPNQYSIGGYTFQLGSGASPLVEHSALRPVVRRRKHPRFIFLHPAVLSHLCTSSPTHIAQWQNIYVLHRPPCGAARSLRFALASPRPLRRTSFSGSCDVVIPRHTSSYLSDAGYVSVHPSLLLGNLNHIPVRDSGRRYTLELVQLLKNPPESITIGLSLCDSDDPSLTLNTRPRLHAAVIEWLTLPEQSSSQPTPLASTVLWEGINRTLSYCERYHVQDWEDAERIFTFERLGKSIRLKFSEWYFEGAPLADRGLGENSPRAAFAMDVTVLIDDNQLARERSTPFDASFSDMTFQSPALQWDVVPRETPPPSWAMVGSGVSPADTIAAGRPYPEPQRFSSAEHDLDGPLLWNPIVPTTPNRSLGLSHPVDFIPCGRHWGRSEPTSTPRHDSTLSQPPPQALARPRATLAETPPGFTASPHRPLSPWDAVVPPPLSAEATECSDEDEEDIVPSHPPASRPRLMDNRESVVAPDISFGAGL